MTDPRRVRRCAALLVRPSERRSLDFAALLGGHDAMRRIHRWEALAPHLDLAIELDADAVSALGAIPEIDWIGYADAAASVGVIALDALIASGLVMLDTAGRAGTPQEQCLHDPPWHPLAAAAHVFSRWSGVDSLSAQSESRIHSTDDLIAEFGPAPPHFHARADARARSALPPPVPNDFDALMARRATCRNFDAAVALSLAQLASLLHRGFGVQGSEVMAAGAVALKKNHPSGGGLHPLEAYVVAQRVDGLAPGLYHYNVESHALDLLVAQSAQSAQAFALTAVAGQDYFAAAPALLIITARFARSFWKYRRHSKIHRAILLEAGHASQNLYLAATDLDLGAFVTAAINEVDIEIALSLDPLQEGVLAVCGFGARASRQGTVELDPAHAVWTEALERR